MKPTKAVAKIPSVPAPAPEGKSKSSPKTAAIDKTPVSPVTPHHSSDDPVLFIRLENHTMHWLYFGAVVVCALCVGCVHRAMQRRRHEGTKTKGRYERVSTAELESDEVVDQRARTRGYRRRKNLNGTDSHPLGSVNVAVNIDNALSRT